jgi:hypothetical protein
MQIRKVAQKCQGGINRILVIYGLSDPNQSKNIVQTTFPGLPLNFNLAAGLVCIFRKDCEFEYIGDIV